MVTQCSSITCSYQERPQQLVHSWLPTGLATLWIQSLGTMATQSVDSYTILMSIQQALETNHSLQLHSYQRKQWLGAYNHINHGIRGTVSDTCNILTGFKESQRYIRQRFSQIVDSLQLPLIVASLQLSLIVASLQLSLVVASLQLSLIIASLHLSLVVASLQSSLVVASLQSSLIVASLQLSLVVASLQSSLVVANLQLFSFLASVSVLPNI